MGSFPKGEKSSALGVVLRGTFWYKQQNMVFVQKNLRLLKHTSRIPNVYPGLDYLSKYVDRDLASGHWFWREGRRNHLHDSRGQARVLWKVRPTHKTSFVSEGSYSVARLLLEHAHAGLPPDFAARSVCGLPQCVNPSHWHVDSRVLVSYVLEAWGPVSWKVLDGRTREEPTRAVAFRLFLPGLGTHAITTKPSFDRDPTEPLSTVCGKPVVGPGLLVVQSPVTCREGC